jgi:hypothetical protein
MKTIWPLGARDLLVNMQCVRYEDKAWICTNSVENDEIPQTSNLLRVHVEFVIYYFKPNPTIQGYTMIIISEFNFRGNIPNSLIGPVSLKGDI